jgi:hypothetical protein
MNNIHNLLEEIVKSNSSSLNQKEKTTKKKTDVQIALEEIKEGILNEAKREEQIQNEQIEYTSRLKRTQMLLAEEDYLRKINLQIQNENKEIDQKKPKIQFEEAVLTSVKLNSKSQKSNLVKRIDKDKNLYAVMLLFSLSIIFFYLQATDIKPKKETIKIITVKKPDMPVKQEDVRLYFIDEINDLIYKPIQNKQPDVATIEEKPKKKTKKKEQKKSKPKINFDLNKNDL